ncbi:MAG: tRNA lysidine(34) synthetase TilS, partial [Myxococcota bacterium]
VLARVRRTIRERRLLREGDHLVVACSGGGDSIALLHLLARLRTELSMTLTAATIDHGLRPVADELALVASQAKELGIPFATSKVNLPRGANLQEAARELRYQALREIAKGGKIATGHTADDQAETVLSRILRGAGVNGLAGIEPRREDGVVRPLLDLRRADLRAFLEREGIPWAEDPSNEDERFERVRLRGLLGEDPQLVPHLAALADEARQIRREARARGLRLWSRSKRDGGLDRRVLQAAAPVARREALTRWAASSGQVPRRAHIEALEELVSSGKGEVLLGDGWGVHLEGEVLVMDQKPRRTRSRLRRDDDPT